MITRNITTELLRSTTEYPVVTVLGPRQSGKTTLTRMTFPNKQELRSYKTPFSPFDLIVRGFYPRLHEEGLEPRRYYNNYLMTYVERDMRALIQLRDLSQFQKFLILLAGRIGQVVNFASLANDVGVSGITIKNWLSVLKASFIIFELPPFLENVGKRVIKSPKIYFTDVGFVAFLLGIHTEEQASRDPLRGGLYENLLIADIIKGALNRGIRPEIYFFRDSHGNEVDLLIRDEGRLTPVEIKSGATFSKEFLKGLERFQALETKGNTPGVVLYNGEQQFNIRGIRIINPLHVEDIWETLTQVPGKEAIAL